MNERWIGTALRQAVIAFTAYALAACGGGGGSGEPAVDQAPTASITSPAGGTTFRAGDTLTFTGSGTDPEDGALGTSRLAWRADLHHDDHSHPLQLATPGAAGTLTVPTRGETSDNIWIRFHLRATDSAGHTHEVSRDVLPRKARLTLATEPPGLQILLDGAPYTSPKTVAGVVGIERDLGAGADQTLLDRQYRFTGWSQGGAREQTISTPEVDTTYTANFVEVTNQPPQVSLSAPATATVGIASILSASATDSDGTIAKVEFFDGATLLGSDTSLPYGLSWAPATAGSRSFTARATDNTGAVTTSAVVTVNVAAPGGNVPPSVTMVAPAAGSVGVAGTLQAAASDSDGTVVRVEFFDGSALLAMDTVAPYSVAWTPLSAGAHSITARATDNAGATTTSAAVVVNVQAAGDNQAPVAVLTAPSPLADALAGTLQLTATASDNVAVAGVEFQIDGVIIGAEDTAAPYAASLDTLAFASGQHVLRARARDVAGNLSPWSSATVRFGGSRPVPAGFSRQLGWVTGLGPATAFAQAPDGRFFVAVQTGRLLVVKNGVPLATPFLNLAVDASGERGLIGVALHPNFATNGWVYVYYTRVNGSLRNNRVSRFVASGDVSTGVETVLVDLPALSVAGNHNGGAMNFGIDGKLYVAVGDNANSAKPQNLNDPFGKMLRFNDDGTIPSDNPFCTTQDIQCAVWAYGLRNPFTFAIQPVTGRMHINDVGQNTWEEINLGAARANFGWPASEGPDNVTAGVTAPIFAYKHTDASPPGSGPGGFFTGVAIVGGAFYPTTGPFPARYRGKYFFVDFTGQWVGVLDTDNGHAAYAFGLVSGLSVGMLVGTDGALYVLSRDAIIRFAVP